LDRRGPCAPAKLLAELSKPVEQAPAPHLTQTFETAIGSPNPPSLSAVVDVLTPYERRVVDVARTQMAKMSGMVAQRDLVAVADFARPSHLPRLHFVIWKPGVSIRNWSPMAAVPIPSTTAGSRNSRTPSIPRPPRAGPI
jgi:hypothetical protein